MIVAVDGSPAGVEALADALERALDGGPAVFPVAGGPGRGGSSARAEGPPTAPAVDDVPPGTAVLVATSGSTGDAKLVTLPASALRASAEATAARLGGPGAWLLALPAEHVAGIQVIVRALLAGHRPRVQDLREGFRPEAFAAATAGLPPGRRSTSLVPTQLLRVLDAGGAALDALRSFDAVLVGGAALDAGLHARSRDAGVRVVTTYGMSETAGGCVYDGVPLDGVTVEIAPDDEPDRHTRPAGPNDSRHRAGPDPHTRPSGTDDSRGGVGADSHTRAAGEVDSRGEVGRILLGGPTLATGYAGRPDETAAAFIGGRFRTGDLGRLVGGRLEVLGRADDVIVTGGEKVAPAAVERVLDAQPGVRASCVTGVPHPEWGQQVVAAVVGERADPDLLRAAVRDALGRAAVPRLIVAVAEIPLRGIGKPDRAAVARLVTDAG